MLLLASEVLELFLVARTYQFRELRVCEDLRHVLESGELKKSCDILGYCRIKCNFYESDNFTSGIF
jgi:hypothetical protein